MRTTIPHPIRLLPLLAAVALAWGCSPQSAVNDAPTNLAPPPAPSGSAGAQQPPQVGETAPDFTLTTAEGETVTLSSLTAERPTAVVVLRGYPGYQ